MTARHRTFGRAASIIRRLTNIGPAPSGKGVDVSPIHDAEIVLELRV
jgi:hypothetical protein